MVNNCRTIILYIIMYNIWRYVQDFLVTIIYVHTSGISNKASKEYEYKLFRFSFFEFYMYTHIFEYFHFFLWYIVTKKNEA